MKIHHSPTGCTQKRQGRVNELMGIYQQLRRLAQINPLLELPYNLERHLTGERAARGCYFEDTRSRSERYRRSDVSVRDDGERSGRAVESNASRASQIIPEDFHIGSNFSIVGMKRHEGRKSGRDFVHGSATCKAETVA